MSSALLMVVTRIPLVARGAGPVVHRAAEFFFREWGGRFRGVRRQRRDPRRHDDAVRMEKISDGGSFAKKFGIRSDGGISRCCFWSTRKGAAEFETSARGERCFFRRRVWTFLLRRRFAGPHVDGGKSASPESFGGVPTHMKIASPARMACQHRRYR